METAPISQAIPQTSLQQLKRQIIAGHLANYSQGLNTTIQQRQIYSTAALSRLTKLAENGEDFHADFGKLVNNMDVLLQSNLDGLRKTLTAIEEIVKFVDTQEPSISSSNSSSQPILPN